MNGEIAGLIEAGETQALVQSRLKTRIAAVMKQHRPKASKGFRDFEECAAGCRYRFGHSEEHIADRIAACLSR